METRRLILVIQKVIIIGFSLGGLIAAHFSSTRKNNVLKTVLFGTIFNRTEEQKKNASDCQDPFKLFVPQVYLVRDSECTPPRPSKVLRARVRLHDTVSTSTPATKKWNAYQPENEALRDMCTSYVQFCLAINSLIHY